MDAPMKKRSPRYPRTSLTKAIENVTKIFQGAHQAKLDMDTAAKLIGFSSSSGGAAATAIGALRQYGLVDGLRGSIGVSDLAMRILQPMNASEKYDAIATAATKPEIFGQIRAHFKSNIPAANEPIRAFLIRNEGFSTSGANELIETFRHTLNSVDKLVADEREDGNREEPTDPAQAASDKDNDNSLPLTPREVQQITPESELIVLPLSSDCRVEMRFVGSVTERAYGRLIKHIELLQETMSDEG